MQEGKGGEGTAVCILNVFLSGVYTSAHVRRTCTPYMCASVNTALE